MLSWILGNTLVAACAAVGVAIVARFNPSRPAVNHTLWLACFALLVMPPLPMAGQVGAGLRSLTQPSAEPVATKIVTPVWGDGSYNDQASTSDSWALASGKGSLVTTGPAAASNELTPLELELYLADLAEVEHAAAETTLLGRLADLLPDWTWSTWLLALWGVGSLACFAWAQSRVHGFHRMVKRSPAGPLELDLAVADVAGRLDVRAPRTRVLQGVGSPAVWCLGRPQLLWPAGQLGAVVSDLGTRSLIAHELAHIARKDHWVARFDVLAVAALWWNPLFWLIRRELHTHAEMACDALALSTYPGDRRRFAEALIEAHGRTTSAQLAMQGLCATTPDSKDFERRLTMIMKNKVSPGMSKGVAALALAGSVLLAPGIGSTNDESTPGLVSFTLPTADDDREAFIAELHDEGEALFRSGDYASSIAVFEELAEVAPDHAMAQARLGFMKIGMGQHAEAKRHFERELELGHGVATATYNLACCDALMGDVQGGLGHLAKAMRMGFDQVDLLKSDGDLDNLRSSRGFDAIVKLTKRAGELREELSRGGSPAERREAYATLARIVSEDGAVIREYAMAVHNDGDYAASEQLFRRQAELGEAPEVADYNVGCALARQGKTDAAFESLFASVKKGFHYPAVVDDPDLAGLHGDKRFAKLTHALSVAPKGDPKAKPASSGERLPTAVQWDFDGVETTDNTLKRYALEAADYERQAQLLVQEQAYLEQMADLREHLTDEEVEATELSTVLAQLEAANRAQAGSGDLERALLVLQGDDARDYLLKREGAHSEAEERYLTALVDGPKLDTLRLPEGKAKEAHRIRLHSSEGGLRIEGDASQAKGEVHNFFQRADAKGELKLPTEAQWVELLIEGEGEPGEECEVECDEPIPGLIGQFRLHEGDPLGDLEIEAVVLEQLGELGELGYLGDLGYGGDAHEVHELHEAHDAHEARVTFDARKAHGAEVQRVLSERIGADVGEVRVRVLTSTGTPVEVDDVIRVRADVARVGAETALRAAEQAHLEAADARETARVHARDAEAQRALAIDARRLADVARRGVEREREEADRVREEAEEIRHQADRIRLESREIEKAALKAEAIRKEKQRQAEIEALKREIDRLERELDKAKDKAKHGKADASAPKSKATFTSGLFDSH
ncbi:MAG: M56 family metallopeptidase [Planctomycetota bacterium]|nr:M56 family metallopeptidase [Planctomycetota bacterium]